MIYRVVIKSSYGPSISRLTKLIIQSGHKQKNDQNTLESVIDVGQGISVGPGKFDKKNKRRALNTHVLCSKETSK